MDLGQVNTRLSPVSAPWRRFWLRLRFRLSRMTATVVNAAEAMTREADRGVRSPRRIARVGLLACGLAVAGCASWSTASTSRRPDGTFELRCKGALSGCLEAVDSLCQGARYDVVSAADERDYRDGKGLGESETRSSVAVIRCGSRGRALFGSQSAPRAESKTESNPVSKAVSNTTAGACVPGSTQECVGPAACRGGQACVADGTGFAPCVCAPPPAPSSPSPSSHDAADAGP
jgi:hypothetical protein